MWMKLKRNALINAIPKENPVTIAHLFPAVNWHPHVEK
jgi:hypothetical protein